MKRILLSCLLISSSLPSLGCGPAASVMPPGQFTEEQKAGAMAEYQQVEDEESLGNNKKRANSKTQAKRR